MKNNLIILAGAVVAMLAMTACGTVKKAGAQPTLPTTGQTGQTVTDPAEAIIGTLGDWQTLQTGGNIKLNAGSSFSSSVQVRMVRDQAIYISLRPLLGVEVGKLVITGDSLFAVDKVHKRYIADKVSMLTAGIPVTVSDVQDIFLGRPFVLGKGTYNQSCKALMTVSADGLTMTANEQYKGYGYAFSFDKSQRIVSLEIIPNGSAVAAYQVNYSDVQGTPAGNIAHGIKANADIKGRKIDFSLSYKDIDWNGKVKIDTSIPTNYKRMSASALFSLFVD